MIRRHGTPADRSTYTRGRRICRVPSSPVQSTLFQPMLSGVREKETSSESFGPEHGRLRVGHSRLARTPCSGATSRFLLGHVSSFGANCSKAVFKSVFLK